MNSNFEFESIWININLQWAGACGMTDGLLLSWYITLIHATYIYIYIYSSQWITFLLKLNKEMSLGFIISLFNTQRVSDVNTSILRSLRLICWVISWVVLFWFDACWFYFVVWLGWCGIRMQAETVVLFYFII